MPENIRAQPVRFAATGSADPSHTPATGPRWYVLWTRSNCEQLVQEELCAKGFESFLPKVGRWSRRGRLRYIARIPMFPGYLFLRQAMDKSSYIEIVKTRGLVRVLGERWDQLGTVPDHEIEAIQHVLAADVPTISYPYLRQGERVRIVHGPLAHAEGILVKTEPKKGLLVLSVELLRQSIAVQIDCTAVAPA